MSRIPAMPPHVLSAFQQIAPTHRAALLEIRDLIFEVAAADDRIGPIEETLRWGEPAYIPTRRKTGSTIRLGMEKTSATPAMLFNCNTTLVAGFREQFGQTLTYSKNRAVLINDQSTAFKAAASMCIASALTYHL